MTSRHVLDRIRERVSDDACARDILQRVTSSAARLPHDKSHAVYVYRSDTHIGDDTSDYHSRVLSNGTLGVALIRDGNVVTFMWRRDNQPATPAALRVDKVWGYKDV